MCWCRGSVAEKIFAPLIASIQRAGGRIQGATLDLKRVVFACLNRRSGLTIAEAG